MAVDMLRVALASHGMKERCHSSSAPSSAGFQKGFMSRTFRRMRLPSPRSSSPSSETRDWAKYM